MYNNEWRNAVPYQLCLNNRNNRYLEFVLPELIVRYDYIQGVPKKRLPFEVKR